MTYRSIPVHGPHGPQTVELTPLGHDCYRLAGDNAKLGLLDGFTAYAHFGTQGTLLGTFTTQDDAIDAILDAHGLTR